jgi:hypothetical protein
MAELDIRSLTCVKKEDPNPKDEVTLYVNGTPVFGPQKMANGDSIAVPVGNQLYSNQVTVELMEEDGAASVLLGSVIIPDRFPEDTDFFGIFDNQFPGAFYFMKYQVVP